MEWLKNMNAAIDYIEGHLDSGISYEEAAHIACCSTFYFQRLFSYLCGITLSEYIRRRKMTQAAFELQQTKLRVTDIALKYGYTSPTSFCRAFQKVHGFSPTAAKNSRSRLRAYPPIRFSVKITGDCALTYRVEEKPPLRLVGVRIALSDIMEENFKRIPDFWKSVLSGTQYAQICALGGGASGKLYGVSVWEDTKNQFYYIAVATQAPAPEGMSVCEIPFSTWAVFETRGYMKEEVQGIFQRFYAEWLPFSGYEYAAMPDIEVYPSGGDPAASGYCEVWMGIRRPQ